MTPATAGALAEPRPTKADDELIAVRGLERYFPIKQGVLQRVVGHVRAVDGVDLTIRRGETLALVGESGCGKSTLARCVAGLSAPTGGGVYFRGRDIAELQGEDWREYRRNCQIVFQDVFASLNPRQLVKDIVARPLRIHHEASGADVLDRVVELLESVGLGSQHLYRYPHQFSGGQRQRISIARALALRPELLVLDEPTSALDVSVQAQILNLLSDLQQQLSLTYLFITHDLGVVRHMADRIAVMYLGRVFELAETAEVFESPRHPYTEALLAASPDLPEGEGRDAVRLDARMPDAASPPQGCTLHTRCPVVTHACGWEVDDALWWLEQALPAAPADVVRRRSPFEADIEFGDEVTAGAAGAALARAPAAMLAALTFEVRGAVLQVEFRNVEPVRLENLGGGHLTSCLLHAPAQRALLVESSTEERSS